MKLEQASEIAQRVKDQLAPHCHRIEIAGSIRRCKADVGDIEIVAIPKPYDVGLFASGIALVVDQWAKVKGELGPKCRYTQRALPEGIGLNLFFAKPENWGLIFSIRTGSARFSCQILARGWVRAGYRSEGGMLYRQNGEVVPVAEEHDLFRIARVGWEEPEARR